MSSAATQPNASQASPAPDNNATILQAAIKATEARLPEVQMFELHQRQARLFALSGLFADIKGQTIEEAIARAFVKIDLGESMGLSAAESMTGIDLIQGRVAVSANIRASRMQRAGYDWDILQLDEKGCRLQMKFKGQLLTRQDSDGRKVPAVVSFTEQEATKAGLIGKEMFKKYAPNMYFARAITNAQRWYAPGVLTLNILSTEEAMDVVDEDFSPQSSPQEDDGVVAPIDGLIKQLFEGTGKTEAQIGHQATKWKAKYPGNPAGLIEWLTGEVAKKQNNGGKKEPSVPDPQAATTQSTAAPTNGGSQAGTQEKSNPSPAQTGTASNPALTAKMSQIFELLGWNVDTQAKWCKANAVLSIEDQIASLEKKLDNEEPPAKQDTKPSPAAQAKPRPTPVEIAEEW